MIRGLIKKLEQVYFTFQKLVKKRDLSFGLLCLPDPDGSKSQDDLVFGYYRLK